MYLQIFLIVLKEYIGAIFRPSDLKLILSHLWMEGNFHGVL